MEVHFFEGRGQDNVLGIAPRYGLDRQLFEALWDNTFSFLHTRSDRPWRPQPPVQQAQGLPPGGKTAGAQR